MGFDRFEISEYFFFYHEKYGGWSMNTWVLINIILLVLSKKWENDPLANYQ